MRAMKPEIVYPTSYTKPVGAKWEYVLTKDLMVRLPWDCGNHDFQDEFGNVWLEFRGRLAIIKKGYAWDGASMAPDFADVILAACVHDAFLQFFGVACFPLTKARIDYVFRVLMSNRFALKWVYWGAVRAFGGVYGALTGGNAAGSCGLPHGP